MIFNTYMGETRSILDIKINSCGHIFAKKGRTIYRPRGRDDYLIFYVAKGAEEFHLQTTVTATDGDFIIFRPGERQEHLCVSEKPSEFYYVHFTVPEDENPIRLPSFTVHSAKPSARVRDLFEALIEEVQCKRTSFDTLSVGLLLTVIGTLEQSVAEESTHGKETMDRIALVLQCINREYAASHTLDDFSAMSNLSKFHFLRIFRKITGVSPIEYRNGLRIEHAKEFLLDTTLSVGEIGVRVGYPSPSHFCDAFKNRVGVSPREYRESAAQRSAQTIFSKNAPKK